MSPISKEKDDCEREIVVRALGGGVEVEEMVEGVEYADIGEVPEEVGGDESSMSRAAREMMVWNIFV